jgi:hypothetical protein
MGHGTGGIRPVGLSFQLGLVRTLAPTSSRLHAPNAKRQTPNAERQTPNAERL